MVPPDEKASAAEEKLAALGADLESARQKVRELEEQLDALAHEHKRHKKVVDRIEDEIQAILQGQLPLKETCG